MKIIAPSVRMLYPNPETAKEQLQHIEYCARNCYDSQDKAGEDPSDFIRRLIKRGHESPLEFASVTFEIWASRAVMAELTRHRLASFCIRSQRYVNEGKNGGVTFIDPGFSDPELTKMWKIACQIAEEAYCQMIEAGATAEQARTVLPNSTATKIEMCANLREWRHILSLRNSKRAYPEMQYIAEQIQNILARIYPCVFGE